MLSVLIGIVAGATEIRKESSTGRGTQAQECRAICAASVQRVFEEQPVDAANVSIQLAVR